MLNIDKRIKKLLQKVKNGNKQNYHIKLFCGGRITKHLIVHNDKIVIPKELESTIVQWYYNHFCHPGKTRRKQTIRQHFTWKRCRKTVHQTCSKCPTC